MGAPYRCTMSQTVDPLALGAGGSHSLADARSLSHRNRFGWAEERAGAIEDAIGDLLLRQKRQALDAPVARQQHHAVGVGAEARARFADVVGDDEVAPLLRQLLSGVALDVFGFGGEADHYRRPPLELGQDVGVL